MSRGWTNSLRKHLTHPSERIARMGAACLAFGPYLVKSLRATRRTGTPGLLRAWRSVQTFRRDVLAGPDWLSLHVESLAGIRRKARLEDPPGLEERLQRALHWFHTFKASARLGGTILAALLALGVIGAVLPLVTEVRALDVAPYMTTIPTTLGAVAAVLATVAALLLAVIVFGLQFHGERLGYTYFLVRYL